MTDSDFFNKKIMIVDDLKSMRSDLIKILQNIGYSNFKECSDGKEAWDDMCMEAQYGNPYQIIFSDINMPIMNGLALLKKLRNTNIYKTTPIFMVSTENEKDVVIKAILEGATDYILKPYNPITVHDKLVKSLFKM